MNIKPCTCCKKNLTQDDVKVIGRDNAVNKKRESFVRIWFNCLFCDSTLTFKLFLGV